MVDVEKPVEVAKTKNEQFYDRFVELIKEFDVQQYAGSFFIEDGKPLLIFNPDVVAATKILKRAHEECRAQVLKSIGE